MKISKIIYLIIALVGCNNFVFAMKDSTIPYAEEIKMLNAQIRNYENQKESIIRRTMRLTGKDYEYAEAHYNKGLAELRTQLIDLETLQNTRYTRTVTASQEK